MNIMNVNNTAFGAKMPVSKMPATRINIKAKTTATEEIANEYLSGLMELRKDAAKNLMNKLDYLDKTVDLYFRGSEVINGQKINAVYINARGPKTTRFDFEQAKDGKEFLDSIMENIDLNA